MDEWLKIGIPLASIVVPLAGGIIAWGLNERSKRKWKRYLRKEDRYRGLLKSISGFYASSQDQKKKEKFLQELSLAWLYCPDNVIKAGNAFLVTVDTETVSSDEEKERALAELCLSLRKDLRGNTELTVKDHRIWRSP